MFMKNIIVLFLFILLPITVLSQKVYVEVIKSENVALSEWSIFNDQNLPAFAGKEYFRDDSISFTLEANKRYFLQLSVYGVYNPDTTMYSLKLNGETVLLIPSEIKPGDYSYPFFTGTKNEPVKITGGTNAVISDFPWQVYYVSGDLLCGGSIISENWVITAAHCTRNNDGTSISPSVMTIKAGATNPYNNLEGQKYNISDVIVHEDYNNTTLENDIALLKLAEPINIANAIPIKLINSDDVASGATDPGVMSWVTGWGLTRVRPEIYPTTLQKVQLPVISNTQASVVWGTIPESDIMAGYLNGNKDACNGDSGGPLVVPVSDEYKLAGIVSWGSDNCNTYGGYSRVSDFETWIRTKTGIEKEFKPPVPFGDTLVCQGNGIGQYSIEPITGATNYEWILLPAEAGIITSDSQNASIQWNSGYVGLSTVKIRVTIGTRLSEWSKLNVRIVKNTTIKSQSADTVLCAEQPVSLND